MSVYDENNDSQADVIGRFGDALYIPSGYEPKRFITSARTRMMTPQMQEATTKLLQANKDLALLIDQDQYMVQQEKKK